MDTLNAIVQILGLLGIGAILGVILQYRISKKLKIFETKLIIFRRVYKQLHLLSLYCSKKNKYVLSTELEEKFGLSLKDDLGDILFYADKELESLLNKLIESLFWTIHTEPEIKGIKLSGLINLDKGTYRDIEEIKKHLRKIIKKRK